MSNPARVAVLLIALSGAAPAGDPVLRLYLDGEYVGTLGAAGVVYRLDQQQIRIQTREGVFGCQMDRVFHDRFEP